MRVADAEAAEGAALGFAVTLDRAAAGPVTVQCLTMGGTATAGEDYTAVAGSLIFLAGETAKTVSVEALADEAEDDGETVILTLSGVAGGAARGRARAGHDPQRRAAGGARGR